MIEGLKLLLPLLKQLIYSFQPDKFSKVSVNLQESSKPCQTDISSQNSIENAITSINPTSTPKSQQTPKLWASVTPITAKIDLPVPHLLLYI